MKKQLIILFFCIFSFTISSSSSDNNSICKQIIQIKKRKNENQNKKFDQLIKKLSQLHYDQCLIQLTPQYYWAQNMSHIMIKFNFQVSSKGYSCSQMIYQQKNISYDGFYLKLYCIQSNQIIKYSLNVKTFKNINFHFSRWKQAEMNKLILEAMKSPSPYFWPKLYSSNYQPKNKAKIWWELQQKQDQQTQKFMGLLQIDYSQHQISQYVKKSRKNNYKQNQDHSQIQFYCNQGSPYYQGSWY